MVRKYFTFATALMGLAALVGFQAPSKATVTSYASIVGWAGSKAAPLGVNVLATVNNATPGGQFAVGDGQWLAQGTCKSLKFSSDSAGNHIEIIGQVYFNGKGQKNVPAIATLTVTQKTDGSNSVGIKVVNYFNHSLLASSGLAPVSNQSNELPMYEGSVRAGH